jgi:hypothetical protein
MPSFARFLTLAVFALAPTQALSGSLEERGALTPAANIAHGARCPAIAVDVITESKQEHDFACSAVAVAFDLLGSCGISPHRLLTLEISREVSHPLGKRAIFGFFDNKLETVFLTRKGNLPPLLAGTPYETLPLQDFYRSLIVHEVVHGVMHQNLKRQPSSHAAYEYPAYALQIASLRADVRDRFLQSVPNNVGANEFIFNDTVLFFDPYYFAAHAYRHFAASDGCAHLDALLKGEVAFIPVLPP